MIVSEVPLAGETSIAFSLANELPAMSRLYIQLGENDMAESIKMFWQGQVVKIFFKGRELDESFLELAYLLNGEWE